MSSINPHFTFNYSQPEEYRFSHDSVFLARWVFDKHREQISVLTELLDLCAGCGIVGLDFLFHCRKELKVEPASIDFLELQTEYATCFAENVRSFGPTKTELNFINTNYSDLTSENKYDLILSNPPYFKAGTGALSASEFKNRCRFFLDSDLDTLINKIKMSLKSEGSAYVLMRNPPRDANIVDQIRGTPLVLVTKV